MKCFLFNLSFTEYTADYVRAESGLLIYFSRKKNNFDAVALILSV